MKFHIHTTGCKVNQWDSYVMANTLRNRGFTQDSLGNADVIIINACTLTEGAEKDVRQFIHRARRLNKEARVVLSGCHAQVYPENVFGADLVLGQSEKFSIDEFLEKEGSFVKRTRVFPMEDALVDGFPTGRTRVFLKVQDGCDRFCAYCVVPFARGKPRSRPFEEIRRVMKTFREKGLKEVVLTGIELSSYCDPETGMDFKGLLQALETTETPVRLRISSIDPLYVDNEFVEIIAGSTKIAKSLHIPLQSGSDAVLEKMGRVYTRQFMGDLLEMIRRRIDSVGIGMDVMVGFPSEDEERFMETYRFLETAGVSYLHVFPYSARQGTRAASWKEDVPDTVKRQRVRILKGLDGILRRRFTERFVGTEAVIIVEGKIYRGSFLRGYTDNYIPVYVPYRKGLANDCVKVTIREIRDNLLLGEVKSSATPTFGGHPAGLPGEE
ncbi:MAG: Threonylcarbamoyladenosine tRNA methylthiotransferase MtaB [Syntrophorhabdus sp. PtaU1.Bin002]|nr:MAG: Threonylcarbamoyladenosine tRNA methylthiotransferase MtaB [Syntrophorhabdus sp. PtaB.Bin006]OPY71506.1 MAG: Threonylcarbamoyladenosine tRNA methylthiotransferase MtaB [Syntrophorhabdus sp. PtaU1.Bin002]